MKKTSTYATIITLMLSLTACGGGSDSTTDTTNNTSTTTDNYVGVTTAATIDQPTVMKLSGLVLAAASREESGTLVSPPGKLSISSKTEMLAGVAGTEILGDCGGTETIEITANTGKYTFDNFCREYTSSTVVQNGVMTIVQADDGSSQTTYSGYVTTTTYTATQEVVVTSIDGGMSYAYNSDTMVQTFTYTNYQVTHNGVTTVTDGTWVYDNATGGVVVTYTYDDGGKIYKVEGFSVEKDSGGNVASITGTFYDPDSGYVTIATTQPFTYDSACAGIPVSGTMEITGADGKKASIVMSGCDSFQVIIDGVSEIYFW